MLNQPDHNVGPVDHVGNCICRAHIRRREPSVIIMQQNTSRFNSILLSKYVTSHEMAPFFKKGEIAHDVLDEIYMLRIPKN